MAAAPSFRSVFGDSELIGRGVLSTYVCATLILPQGGGRARCRNDVAQTLLSVLVSLRRVPLVMGDTLRRDTADRSRPVTFRTVCL